MTPEQDRHQRENCNAFIEQYSLKYEDGQKHHGGNMWEMGAYQALEQMEQEVLDQWSYCRQIRKCLDETKELLRMDVPGLDEMDVLDKIEDILNRQKEDGE